MTEWELIQQSAGEQYSNDHISYSKEIADMVEFAICLPDWRDPRPIAVNEIQRLRFLGRRMQRLWQENGIQYIWGALVQFSHEYPDFEIWYNGERL